MLLTGSPMCTAFSTWQRINSKMRDGLVVEAERRRAVQHLEFTMELYKEQLRHGRYFLHEHPAYATSWQEACVKKIREEPDVVAVVGDQCMYGCQSFNGQPVKKPTRFMTNAPEMAKRLGTRCDGRGGAARMGRRAVQISAI